MVRTEGSQKISSEHLAKGTNSGLITFYYYKLCSCNHPTNYYFKSLKKAKLVKQSANTRISDLFVMN